MSEEFYDAEILFELSYDLFLLMAISVLRIKFQVITP